MNTRLESLHPLAVLLALAACGGEAVLDQSGGGGSGGTVTTTSTSSSTSTSTSTTVTGDCDELAAQYAVTLEQAKDCNPVLSSPQCTLLVDDQLGCPCPTYVNPASEAAVAELAALIEQWFATGCQIPCPLIDCPDLQGAGCSPQGHCVDYGPD